ncbi:MAG TPA: efflux RND transporter periplasmic adaptor subunit [Gammaproteobacteria bacterium]|nr:efflux RND transporter periplasmic adaptor subunit [Gammaproteobacteria bacterium]
MKTLGILLLGAALGAAALYGVGIYQPGLLPGTASDGGDGAPAGADGGKAKKDGEREVLYWVAPMDDSYRRDEPGKSPMGMDLVPVYADEAAARPGTVKIDPSVVNNLGVKTAKAERRDLSRTLRTVGTVTYDERKVSHIHTRVEGWVEELHLDAEGDRVEVDQAILEIYSPELVTAQEEYLLAKRRARRLGGGVDSPGSDMVRQARERLLFYGVSPREIDELEETGEIQRTVVLRAPHAGVVTELGVREGMRVTPEKNLYTVANLSTVWVQADVYAYQAEWVAEGDPVTLELPFLPGRQWTGKVDYVYPYLDPTTRTVTARLVFANPDGTLKPNMFATAVIEADPQTDVVAVPREAVIRTGKRTVVVTALGDGAFRPAPVETGVTSGEWVEIRQGLAAGQKVVTSGQFLLDAEADFDAAMERMESEEKDMEGMDHGDMPQENGGDDMDHEGHDMEDMSSSAERSPVGAASPPRFAKTGTLDPKGPVTVGAAVPAAMPSGPSGPAPPVGAASSPRPDGASQANRGGDAAPTTASGFAVEPLLPRAASSHERHRGGDAAPAGNAGAGMRS